MYVHLFRIKFLSTSENLIFQKTINSIIVNKISVQKARSNLQKDLMILASTEELSSK